MGSDQWDLVLAVSLQGPGYAGGMTPLTFLVIVASVAMSACAQLLLKLGVAGAKAQGWQGGPEVLFKPLVFAGFALYGLGAVLWLYVLARLPLSAAYPFVGIGFLFTMALGVSSHKAPTAC